MKRKMWRRKSRREKREKKILIPKCNPRKQTTKNASPESHPRKLTSPPFQQKKP